MRSKRAVEDSMQVVDLAKAAKDGECAVALGYFDSFHRGHCSLLRLAADTSYIPCLFTFEGDYYGALGQRVLPLYTFEQRCRLAAEQGIERIYTLASTTQNMTMSCGQFVDLLQRVEARVLVCGEDFRFGKGAQGDVHTLADLCTQRHIALRVTDLARDSRGCKIGTAAMRQALQEGDMDALHEGLGRWYAIEGVVQKGRAVGRTMGIPTANIALPTGIQPPKAGVYACYCVVDGAVYAAVCNVGAHPTFGDGVCNVEAYLMGYDGNLYGALMQVALVAYLRPIIRFDNAESLCKRIQIDCQKSIQILQEKGYD